jgi:hypothetical protein
MSALAIGDRLGSKAAKGSPMVVPEVVVRSVGALLALGVAAVHVADQGGVAAFTSPDWLGWVYRLIEVGGVLTALALLWPRTSRVGWSAGVLLGAAPFLGYVISRTVGVPGDSVDIGNWGDWVGTVGLFVEAALVTLSVTMLLTPTPEVSGPASQARRGPGATDLTSADTWSLWLPMNLK